MKTQRKLRRMEKIHTAKTGSIKAWFLNFIEDGIPNASYNSPLGKFYRQNRIFFTDLYDENGITTLIRD